MPKKKRPATRPVSDARAPAKQSQSPRRKRAVNRDGPRSMVEEHRNATRAQRPLVRFLDENGAIAALPVFAEYEALVSRWTYVLQSRRGWANREATRHAQARNALEELRRINLTDEQLQRIGAAGRVEVCVFDPDPNPSEGDRQRLLAARRVPWEYLLSAATGALGRERRLSITRHVGGMVRPATSPPRSLLYLQSAPGALAMEFDFSSERRVVTSALRFEREKTAVSDNEGHQALLARIRRSPPDVIHIAGIDVHQARDLLGEDAEIDDSRDGLVLRGERRKPASLHAEELARLLVRSAGKPRLIAFNLYHSAAELAAEAVAHGASAAIGFQDEIDDETAEFFFAAFYHEWRRSNWNLFDAFSAAWRTLRDSIGHLHGTGIVLWSATSAFAQQANSSAPTSGAPRLGTSEGRKPSAASHAKPAAAATATTPNEPVLVSLDIQREVNYALLHNELSIFRNFTLHKKEDGPDLLVEVTVELNVGSDSYPFRHMIRLSDKPAALADMVKLPLTSSLARALRERVQSTLYVCVKANGTVVHQKTERVTLLPVDEWLDDGKQSAWLPSFVLPRDPAVGRVIDAAQRYLMALQDDPAAGFDGYQQVDPTDHDSTAMVDLQVRALWCALCYDFGLSYINPPPSYSNRTQRLRTPSDVLNGKRGTCIDLALLLAACLEYVDIYPCVILLTGHAFPAYWRSSEAHEKFLLANNGSPTPTDSTSSTGALSGYNWQFKRGQYAQIMQCVQRGDLVPLETVGLTSRTSFEAAKQDGLENLRSKSEFDSLLDLMQARLNEPPVTPLPIIQLER